MKIINITDIEDLISTKIEIDKILLEHKDIEKKMSIQEYMDKYCTLNKYAYNCCGDVIPFAYYNVYGNEYLFITEESDNINELINKLKEIKFDYNKLKQISHSDIIGKYEEYENAKYFIIDGKYFE